MMMKRNHYSTRHHLVRMSQWPLPFKKESLLPKLTWIDPPPLLSTSLISFNILNEIQSKPTNTKRKKKRMKKMKMEIQRRKGKEWLVKYNLSNGQMIILIVCYPLILFLLVCSLLYLLLPFVPISHTQTYIHTRHPHTDTQSITHNISLSLSLSLSLFLFQFEKEKRKKERERRLRDDVSTIGGVFHWNAFDFDHSQRTIKNSHPNVILLRPRHSHLFRFGYWDRFEFKFGRGMEMDSDDGCHVRSFTCCRYSSHFHLHFLYLSFAFLHISLSLICFDYILFQYNPLSFSLFLSFFSFNLHSDSFLSTPFRSLFHIPIPHINTHQSIKRDHIHTYRKREKVIWIKFQMREELCFIAFRWEF